MIATVIYFSLLITSVLMAFSLVDPLPGYLLVWPAIVFVACFINKLVGAMHSYKEVREEARLRCSHGITGGASRNKCTACIRDAENQNQKLCQLSEYKRMAAQLEEDERKRLLEGKLKQMEFLLSLSPQQFEDEVAKMFELLGYSVTQTSYSNDRGKDAIATKEGKKYLIECKRYDRRQSIGRPALQKFFAAMHEENAEKGFFVTTSSYAGTASEYAIKNNIQLIDGDMLITLMKKAYPRYEQLDIYRVLCAECGSEVTFNFCEQIEEKLCANEHLVKPSLKPSTAST